MRKRYARDEKKRGWRKVNDDNPDLSKIVNTDKPYEKKINVIIS